MKVLCAVLVAAAAAEVGSGEVYSVIEIGFTGPTFGPSSSPARDVDFWVRFRHESGAPEYKVHGFWDGDGAGGASGNVFRVRFCPTKAGRWTLVEVHSNRAELLNEKEGDYVTATASTRKGFWLRDPASPGPRWYKRSNGSRAYIFGNTHYSFLSERRDTGPTGSDIASDVNANAAYFNKLRFSIHAVKTAFAKDLIADLILAGPDSVDARATLRASGNGGDNTPYLKYVAARYGSYPNAWLCLCNEYDIKTPTYTNAQINAAGQALRSYLPYPTPVSVHAAPNDWDAGLNTSPAWHDHYILQSKIKDLSDAADTMKNNHPAAGGDTPGINDELGYQGAGDGWNEGDVIEGHLGAFLGGGYGTTGEKYANKLGQYFWGDFDATTHGAADNLLWIRQRIDANVSFWMMKPATPGIFGNLDGGFRALEWAGNEYVLGTDTARASVQATLPAGTWTVKRFDAVAKTESTLTTGATGTYTFDAPASRAVFFHFKKTGASPPPPAPGSMIDVPCEADTYVYQNNPTTSYGTAAEIAVGAGTDVRHAFLRFNVSGLPAGATVTDARLLLRCNGSSTQGGGTIRKFAPTNATWSETQPTWNSPLAGADASGDLSSVGPVSAGNSYSFTNLHTVVGGNGRVTFVIRSSFQDGAQYRSREHGVAAERPILRLTYSGGTGGGFAVTVDSVSTGKPYSLATAKVGALPYIDRSYTVTSLSAALADGRLIRTANDDKYVTANPHLRFTVSAAAVVYVCYDQRGSPFPTWLDDGTWTVTGLSLVSTDGSASPMRVLSKSVAAGQVSLGGNRTGGANGALSNYVVVVQPAVSSEPVSEAASIPEDGWVHDGDTDGDGLEDGFETAQGTDPLRIDTDDDGTPDEYELTASGGTLWDLWAAGAPPAGGSSGGGGGSGGCGLTGLESLLVITLLKVLSKQRR